MATKRRRRRRRRLHRRARKMAAAAAAHSRRRHTATGEWGFDHDEPSLYRLRNSDYKILISKFDAC